MSTSSTVSSFVGSAARRRSFILAASGSLLVAMLVAGCANEGSGSSTGGWNSHLPGAIGGRWTPPEFATRSVDGARAVVLDGCVTAANAMGFSVSRFDGATGKISATRRQAGIFDGAREDMLDITVTTLAPDVTTVAIVLREAVESSGFSDEHSGGMVTAALVRDRAPYDAFFARLDAVLRPAGAPAPAAPAAPVPAAP